MRTMAYVVTVKEKKDIKGKDRIKEATFEENSYASIISNEIEVGEKVCWIEADSILPEKPQWEFLRKRCFRENLGGFLIKPMTMSGVKSWGLVVRMKEAGLNDDVIEKLKSGDSLEKLFEIRKYEPEEDASPKPRREKKKSGMEKFIGFLFDYRMTRWFGRILAALFKEKKESCEFPEDIISKSDETTIQNMPDVLEKYKESEIYITAKMEGQSISCVFDYNKDKKKVGKFYVCSRNKAYRNKNELKFWDVALEKNIEEKLREYYKESGRLICFQAEQCGPGIQSNIYNFKNKHWFVYTMKDEVSGKQLSFEEMERMCRRLGLDVVPCVDQSAFLPDKMRLGNIFDSVDSAVKFAESVIFKPVRDESGEVRLIGLRKMEGDKLWDDVFQHEGIVVRSVNYDKDNGIGFSFKVKNMEYAEKGLGTINVLVKKYLDRKDREKAAKEAEKAMC